MISSNPQITRDIIFVLKYVFWNNIYRSITFKYSFHSAFFAFRVVYFTSLFDLT